MQCNHFLLIVIFSFFFFSSRRRHTRSLRDWSSDVCSSDLHIAEPPASRRAVSASRAVRELGYGAQGNEVNRSLKSVWFAAPPSMGLTLKISSTVRSVELWS